MLAPYLRSSSLGRHEFCPHAYLCEYNLGIRGESNIKADKGTIVHKVLEILAKLSKQKNDIEDKIVGTVSFKKHNINQITQTVYEYYSQKIPHNWGSQDLKDCKKWVQKVIDFNNGQFDPRKLNVKDSEIHFDFEITEPWAAYAYQLFEKTMRGMLSLKGTIDLVVDWGNNVYEIIDWKTGRRLNWADGTEKTHEKLMDDPQLRMYHYAAHHIYPEADQIFVTIFFINDGGPFSMCYSKADLPKTEAMLKEKFETIKNCQVPTLNKSWKCTKLCHYGKHTFEGTHVKPLIEFRRGQTQNRGETMTICEQVKYEIERRGLNQTIELYMVPGFELDAYHEPGSV